MQYRRHSAPALIAGLVLILLLGCTPQDDSSDRTDVNTEAVLEADRTGETIRLAYPEWSSEIASAHLFQAVLQDRLGYRVDLIPVDVEEPLELAEGFLAMGQLAVKAVQLRIVVPAEVGVDVFDLEWRE